VDRPEVITKQGLVGIGRAVLPDQLARPPLRHAEHSLQVFDGAVPAGRAHQFPAPAPFKASIWSSLPATIRFSRAFSAVGAPGRSPGPRASACSKAPPCHWR
jgi:hypothetical protein